MFQLGETLHMSIAEILAMPVSEFHGWLAHFKRSQERR